MIGIQFYFRLIFFFLLVLYCHSSIAQSNLKFEVSGVDEAAEANIQLRLVNLIIPNKPLTSQAVLRIYDQGRMEVKKGLEPYGFFRARVTSDLIRQNNNWIAKYYVEPGTPLRITTLSMQVKGHGAHNHALLRYLETQPMKVGDIFSVPHYDHVKLKLFSIAKNHGYLRAFFDNHILVDLIKYTCQVSIELMTGPEFYFGHIRFKTLPYSECFLRRFLNIREGDVFSSKKILKLQRRMEKSYYFKRVVFKPNFTQIHDRKVPVDIYLTPPMSQHYSLGLGYGTLTGPRVSGGISLRHIGNEGHHLEAELKVSRILSGGAITYYMPGRNPLTDEWLIGTNYKSFHPKGGRSNSVTVTEGISKKYDLTHTNLTLNYLTDGFAIYRKPPARRSHEFYPSLKLSYVKADNLADPHNGHSINLTLQAATQQILSTTSFAGLQTRLKWFISPYEWSRLILRGDLGVTAVHNLPVYPMALRFFTGGITTVRGFADSSIGPGKYLMVGSTEYQQRIKGNFYGAIFYDVGLAANSFHARKNRGAGLGVVYYTQVGPIKLYVAEALSKHTHPRSIEFSVGPEFS